MVINPTSERMMGFITELSPFAPRFLPLSSSGLLHLTIRAGFVINNRASHRYSAVTLRLGGRMKLDFTTRLVVCLLVALLTVSCSPVNKRKKVAFVTNNAANFWKIAQRGCEKADQELDDVDVEFKIPGEGTAAEQRRIIDDLLARGVDGIAISPVDPINQTQLLNDA